MDPITELLSQLSGVRRAATLVSGGGPSVGAIGTGTASRLQQLQVSGVCGLAGDSRAGDVLTRDGWEPGSGLCIVLCLACNVCIWSCW